MNHFLVQLPEGIPSLPDLTHPNELIDFGGQLIYFSLIIFLIIGILGIIIAVINFSLRRNNNNENNLLDAWLKRYFNLLEISQHGILILIILITGFFLCSTLANRYHHWEQAKITEIAATVSGERLEQNAPKIRYTVEVPYSYYTQIDGKLVKIEETQLDNRYLALKSSDIEVNIDQVINQQDQKNNYITEFTAVYQVENSLKETKELFLEISPPYGYSLLKNFRVEQDQQKLEPENPQNYSFPLTLSPGQTSNFRVTYQAQGAPRWVYNAGGELISNFRLKIKTSFPQADFASGIVPNEMKPEGKGTIFTWIFEENVSVINPFGVFTATDPIRNTGVLPRLLLLTPAIFLWWILLLYLSIDLKISQVAIAAGLFFAFILTLTYLSRLMDAPTIWGIISLILLALIAGLGQTKMTKASVIICTIAGAIIPVFGLLIDYSGLTLSLAGILSTGWLAIRHWYYR
jgi:hypothetical protein